MPGQEASVNNDIFYLRHFTHDLELGVNQITSHFIGFGAVDFRSYWEPHTISRRIGTYGKGMRMPGLKRVNGYPQIIPGINMPGQEASDNSGISYFRPFTHDLGLRVNKITGHFIGFGAVDFRSYWEPHTISRRIGTYGKGMQMPGLKRVNGYPQIIPGINMPAQEASDNNGISYFRPFTHDLGIGVNKITGHMIGFGALDFRSYWEPHTISRRIGTYGKGMRMPGLKRGNGYPQIIPGINMPGQEASDNNGISYFRPFTHDLGLGVNRNRGHSFGVGLYAAPSNHLKLPIDQLYPALLANGGSMPKFNDNPLLGSFDPFGTGFTTGVAKEAINYNFGGNLKFTEALSKQDFDLGGGFSTRKGAFHGGVAVPILSKGVQWPLAGHITNVGDDINVQYGHSLNNLNPLNLPIASLYPDLLADSIAKPLTKAQNIPIVLKI